MPYPAYLTIGEYSELEQNGCIPLAWLALLRDAGALDTPSGGFGGWETTPWEATDSLDRVINVLQSDPYLWEYFSILSLLLDELQQVPTEETIQLNVSEFAALDAAHEAAARAASDDFRAMLRLVHRGERDAAYTALRELSARLTLDRGLPFTGGLPADIALLEGPETALQELTWAVMGEVYDGPPERAPWYKAAHYRANFWHWLDTPPAGSGP